MVELSEGIRGLDVFSAIRRRRSIREYTGGRLPDEDLERILDLARYAASPENYQNVRYIVVREDSDMKRLIADLSQEAARELFGLYPYELVHRRLWYIPESRRPREYEDMRDGSLFRYPEKCDAVVIGCASETFLCSPLTYPNEFFGSITLGMAVQNMWLAASALGYGAGYQAFPVMDARRTEIICDTLGIPRTWKPIATLNIGVPARRRMVGPSRWPMEGSFYSERWGNPYVRLAFRRSS